MKLTIINKIYKRKSNKCTKIDEETLNKLHKVELEIFDWVVNICEKNKLNYFLAGGTLIGAIRHKGFIPWDDDLDITMPRADFEKFLEITKKNKYKNYFIQYHTTEKDYWLPFIKVRKKNTYFKEEGTDRYNGEKGIFIDIFPLDYAPKQKSVNQFMQAFLVKGITRILRYRSIKCGSLIKVIIFGGILNFLSTRKLIRVRDKIMKIYNGKARKYFINLGSGYSYRKQTIPKDKFFPSKTLIFENKKANVPNNYDYILKRVYNNYMEIPPIEKRVCHLIEKPIFDTDINK